MNEHIETESPNSYEEDTYHYPWARSLMLVVLYVALMVFLWHFPTTGGRAFFRGLFRGLLTVVAGLAVVGVTLLLILLVLPAPRIPEDDDMYDEDEAEYDFAPLDSVIPAYSILVPALKKPETEPFVWDLLGALEQELVGMMLADTATGIVTVTEVDAETAAYNVEEIRARLKQAGITTRRPR